MSSGFASMSQRHAFGLEALAEMTGKLLQAAYLRASQPRDPEDQDRAILMFDRLARGFRLTIALEARHERERLCPPAPAQHSDPASPAGRPSTPARERPSCEADSEREADLEPSDLPIHIRSLRQVVAGDADILDSDGEHGRTLDRWTDVWGDVVHDKAPAAKDAHAELAPPPIAVSAPPRSPVSRALRRASG